MTNVTAFPVINLTDIPAMVRHLADEVGDATGLVYIFENEEGYFAGSMGRISPMEAVGLASLATRFFQNEAIDDD